MITPQAIREKTFEKAVFGGYDMASVDSFLEELVNDFTTMQKENAVLKAKMKVLVDKVEEYRGNEDAMLCRRQLDFLKKIGEMDFVQQLRTEPAAAPAQPAAPVQQPAAQPEIHETVKSIEETVAKVMDEPTVTVRPDIAPTVADDERPTRAFGIVSDPADDIDKTTQFSLDDLRK